MITCTVCGQSFSLKEIERGHQCITPNFSDSTSKCNTPVKYEVASKHSIIVNGFEHWVDDKKLAIIEQIIGL